MPDSLRIDLSAIEFLGDGSIVVRDPSIADLVNSRTAEQRIQARPVPPVDVDGACPDIDTHCNDDCSCPIDVDIICGASDDPKIDSNEADRILVRHKAFAKALIDAKFARFEFVDFVKS